MSCPATLVFNRYLNRCDRMDIEPPAPCSSNPCKNDGTCVDKGSYRFKCKCTEGFSGERCEKGTDPCLANPCSPNGACLSLDVFKISSSRYYCLCDGGHTYGLNCDTGSYHNPCLKYHSESYYASELSPSLFIHCEGDIMNLKSCLEPLVWSQSLLTCVTLEELNEQARLEMNNINSNDNAYVFVDDYSLNELNETTPVESKQARINSDQNLFEYEYEIEE